MAQDFDWNIADPTAQESIPLSFPAVFWQHGDSNLDELGDKNIKYRGGLFFISDDELQIPGWYAAHFKGDKDEVHGYAATAAHVAFVRYRRRWFKEDNGHRNFRPWNQYEQGYRAHMQVVGFIRGYDEPVCFSFKGMVVNYIQSILKEHHGKVMSIANKTAPEGRKLPSYAIWTTIKSGDFEKAGTGAKTSEVTYPQIVLPKTLDKNWCLERYVGKDRLIAMQDLFREADIWAREWDGSAEDSTEATMTAAASTGADSYAAAVEAQAPPAGAGKAKAKAAPEPEMDTDGDIPF